uniref:alpha-1,2-Mannosidase n=2 Tax=Panagrolaimus TaxID=55784 RepID=A0A914P2M9_9BILA
MQKLLYLSLLAAAFWTRGCCKRGNEQKIPYPFFESDLQKQYGKITKEELKIAQEQVENMFWFGYGNYMKHAFPLDELDPIHCKGRGPDYDNPENININDALGAYSLTLVDSLTSLAIFGNKTAFHQAVQLVIDNVNFENDVTVQVFEATIRVIGSLLSTHLILTNENPYIGGEMSMNDYDGELLTMTHDLANRLLVAFANTNTQIPYPRVNLLKGVLPDTINETCTAGAGSLVLEFGILSKLLNDGTYEKLARIVNDNLWLRRNLNTGLLGNVIDIQTGEWKGILSGTGAGIDSYYEYLLKAFILFGSNEDYLRFKDSAENLDKHLRHTKIDQDGNKYGLPFYTNVDMRDGSILNTWIDSLQASFPGVKVLAGDLRDAVVLHGFYYVLWQKYEGLPERFNWQLKTPDVEFYPLRPEFAESTYLLYQATKSPFYQHVGREIIDALNKHTRVVCGFATIHSVHDKSLEDRMESFFLSETCKYLYLLFNEDHPINANQERIVFSTEGHPFPVLERFQTNDKLFFSEENNFEQYISVNDSCASFKPVDNAILPLDEIALQKLYNLISFSNSISLS